MDIYAASTKNWTEDFSHENGNYLNKCVACEETFFGHKRRVICKECAPNVPIEHDLRETADAVLRVAQHGMGDGAGEILGTAAKKLLEAANALEDLRAAADAYRKQLRAAIDVLKK